MPLLQTRRDTLASFDGGVRVPTEVARPDKLRFWSDRDWPSAPAAISRGAGLSYAAASFGAGAVSIEHRYFDRLVAFDERSGELTVEAGASLWNCQQFLLSRGFFLPCHPGHGRITIGGCVAAEVHGKNPWRDGTFSAQVRGLTLLHPDYGLLTLDQDNHPELLSLTCGAFGLTGHILTVTLAARALPAPQLMLTRLACATFAEAFEYLRQVAQTADFAYSWHDLSSRQGTHFVFVAESEDRGGQHARDVLADAPILRGADSRRLPAPFYNRLTLPLLNAAYRLKTRRFHRGTPIGILEALFPIHGSQAYFTLYGRKGFHEYQALVPGPSAVRFAEEARSLAARHRVVLALCSAKAFAGDPCFIRFAGDGMSIALDFPRGANSARLMADLDELLIDLGGKPNIAKDSRLPADVVRACYPDFEVFHRELVRFDPKRRIRSELSDRLGL